MKIRELLQEMVDQNASDIFIVAGLPLTYQVEGRQVRWDAPLMPADTYAEGVGCAERSEHQGDCADRAGSACGHRP